MQVEGRLDATQSNSSLPSLALGKPVRLFQHLPTPPRMQIQTVGNGASKYTIIIPKFHILFGEGEAGRKQGGSMGYMQKGDALSVCGTPIYSMSEISLNPPCDKLEISMKFLVSSR